MAVKPIPEGYHSVTPSITCRDAAAAIEFYKRAFDARETVRMASPDGKVSHAEIKIGDSIIFVADEFPGMSAAPSGSTPPSVYLFLYVNDVDSVFNDAIGAGARAEMPVQDMFWGDRYGKLLDPFGHHWGLATHVEDVAPEEMERRGAEFMKKAAAAAQG
jgi:PhnB protein